MVAKYAGERFGNLTVVARSGTNHEGRALWECVCDCGATLLATSKQLTRGHKTGCRLCQDSGSKSPLAVRLKKYVVDPVTGCWNWTGKQNKAGYGCITVEGVGTRAHRAMYFLLNQEADRSLVVMHMCDNPRCINPEHLRLGTQRDNMLDMHSKGRFKGGAPKGNKNAVGNQGWKKVGLQLNMRPASETRLKSRRTDMNLDH